jgi:hypothetical protein
MRKSTQTTEELYRKSYEKIIREINAGGKVEIVGSDGQPFTVNTGRSLRRIDIYNIVAQDIGLGHSEYTAARYIKKIIKEKSRVI